MWKIVRDWLLPFIATFCGVFLAAYLTYLSEVSRENQSFDQLLRVLYEDTNESWLLTQQALRALPNQHGREEKTTQKSHTAMRQPTLLLSSLRANPAVLAKFNPLTFAELISLLTDIEGGIQTYSDIQRQAKGVALATKVSDDSHQMLEQMKNNLATDSFNTLVSVEHALRRALFLLQVEKKYRAGKIAQNNLDELIKAPAFELDT